MGYVEYLKDVLRPLHIYDLDSGTGADEITVLGTALNSVYSELETTLREMIPLTAQSYGLDRYESMLPYIPACERAEDRGQAIAALSSVSGFSIDAINQSVRGCGIEATVKEYGTETVIVSFKNENLSAEESAKIEERIEQIIPCHLAIIYEKYFATWRQLEHENMTWRRLEFEELTWLSLQMYDVEVED